MFLAQISKDRIGMRMIGGSVLMHKQTLNCVNNCWTKCMKRNVSSALLRNTFYIGVSTCKHKPMLERLGQLTLPLLWPNSHVERLATSSIIKEKKFTIDTTGDLLTNIKQGDSKDGTDKKGKAEDSDKTIRTLKFTFCAFAIIITTIGIFLIYNWGSPVTDEFGKPLTDQFSDLPILQQYIYRTINEAKNMNKMIIEPSRDKLLPDPLKEPYIQPPYTLVLEMKDILVHPEWTYETGWRFKKRPGLEFLLQHCGPPLFEVVIYTNEQAFTAYPVIEQLDPNGFIWYKLFKDSTRYANGKHLKDLSCLNRDLEKIIVVDWDKEAITSIRNQLTLKRWDGNMSDHSLVELAMMLRTIAESQVSDVREVLDYYRSFSDPIAAFVENQRVAQEHEAELQKAVLEQSSQRRGLTSSWTSSFLKRS